MIHRNLQAHRRMLVCIGLLAVLPNASMTRAEWIEATSYGTWTEANVGQFSYSSELDHRHAVEDERKALDKKEREERQYQERQEAAERRRENRTVYVPKPQQKPALTVTYTSAPNVTVDRIVNPMVRTPTVSTSPPVRVATRREGYELIGAGEDFFHYKDGHFFMDVDGELMRVTAPPGAMVSKIPEGAEVREVEGVRCYIVEETWFQRVLVSGYAVFKVLPS